MNCADARLRIGADPDASDPLLEAHLAQCEDCRRLQMQMRAMNQDLRQLLTSVPPVGSTQRIDSEARPHRLRRRTPWALAASLAALLVSALLIWSLRPSSSLAADVVTHIKGEPDSWSSRQHPAASDVAALLAASGVSLDSRDVIYAQRCVFRGHAVPHLVVHTRSGPWTVMLLSHEHVSKAERFSESGYTGELLPARRGALAVVGLSSDSAHLTEVTAELAHAIHFGS